MHRHVMQPLLASLLLGRTMSSVLPIGVPLQRVCTITSQGQVDGPAYASGASAYSGETITYAESHAVGTTWTVGGDLGLTFDEVFAVGISASVSQTITDTTAEGISIPCPSGGTWTCGVMFIPQVWQVSGETWTIGVGGTGPNNQQPYTMLSPIKDDSGNGIFRAEAPCACTEFVGWADPGAPPACPAGTCT